VGRGQGPAAAEKYAENLGIPVSDVLDGPRRMRERFDGLRYPSLSWSFEWREVASGTGVWARDEQGERVVIAVQLRQPKAATRPHAMTATARNSWSTVRRGVDVGSGGGGRIPASFIHPATEAEWSVRWT
jgi:hypothetical protein